MRGHESFFSALDVTETYVSLDFKRIQALIQANGAARVPTRYSRPCLRCRHRRRRHGVFDALSPRRTGRRRCRPARAQQADIGHHVALGGPGPGAALDAQPHRSHSLFHFALFPARSRNRPGHRLDQQGLAVDCHQSGPSRPHQAPGGIGQAVRRRSRVDFRRRGAGTLAADERQRRDRCRVVAGRRPGQPVGSLRRAGQRCAIPRRQHLRGHRRHRHPDRGRTHCRRRDHARCHAL